MRAQWPPSACSPQIVHSLTHIPYWKHSSIQRQSLLFTNPLTTLLCPLIRRTSHRQWNNICHFSRGCDYSWAFCRSEWRHLCIERSYRLTSNALTTVYFVHTFAGQRMSTYPSHHLAWIPVRICLWLHSALWKCCRHQCRLHFTRNAIILRSVWKMFERLQSSWSSNALTRSQTRTAAMGIWQGGVREMRTTLHAAAHWWTASNIKHSHARCNDKQPPIPLHWWEGRLRENFPHKRDLWLAPVYGPDSITYCNISIRHTTISWWTYHTFCL